MRVTFGWCRSGAIALLLFAFAQAAYGAEMLHCRDAREVFAGRKPAPSAAVHVVIVDPFKDLIMFDQTMLGVNIINNAVISGWAQAYGANGQERITLNIDRAKGTFTYTIATDEKPQFSRRIEGACAVAAFEPQF